MKLPTLNIIFPVLEGWDNSLLHIDGEWGKYSFSFSLSPMDIFNEDTAIQLIVIHVEHEDGRELIFDCDWGLGYYPNAHTWKWWGESMP